MPAPRPLSQPPSLCLHRRSVGRRLPRVGGDSFPRPRLLSAGGDSFLGQRLRVSACVAMLGAAALAGATPVLPAQVPSPPRGSTLSAADSLLIRGILTAEERRQAAAVALREGAAHRDPWMRWLAARASARITDPSFSARDSLGQPFGSPLPQWPAPEWQARLDALTPRAGCELVATAIADRAPLVQLRAATLAASRADCADTAGLLPALHRAVDALPAETSTRAPERVSWQLAAQALVALSRLSPDAARERLAMFVRHPQPQLRRDAARAAAILGDHATLRTLAADADANVLEAVIEGLHASKAPGADSVAVALLAHPAPQVIRAAAEALRDSPHAGVRDAATAALARLGHRRISYERDARVALRQLLGQPAEDDVTLPLPEPLPRDVVGLAIGERRYLEVTMAAEFGGGRFVVELRGDVAPIMATRVLQRARAGDYDGTTWHRVVPNFIVQGLSPDANEYVGYAPFLVDELSAVPHPRGSVGMSTRGHDTGDAQWFINTRDNPRLAQDYTVFAAVVRGMDVVHRLLEGDRVATIREVSAPRP